MTNPVDVLLETLTALRAAWSEAAPAGDEQSMTDTALGCVLLCTSCHHRVHSEGWEIRIEKPPGGSALSGTVWFIPPAHIDPTRTPRMGGRHRFDPLVWNLTGQADALPDVVTAR